MLGLGKTNLHSALVAWAKVVLPLVALAILSILFLVNGPIDPSEAIPYAKVDIEDRLADPRLTQAVFAGTTPDGTTLTLKAREAVPAPSGGLGGGRASGLVGQIETADGVVSLIESQEVRLDPGRQIVALSGGVRLINSLGYALTFMAMDLSLDRTRLESLGPVSLQAPLGQLAAGKMVLTRGPDGSYVMDFTQGVRLIYQPKPDGTP